MNDEVQCRVENQVRGPKTVSTVFKLSRPLSKRRASACRFVGHGLHHSALTITTVHFELQFLARTTPGSILTPDGSTISRSLHTGRHPFPPVALRQSWEGGGYWVTQLEPLPISRSISIYKDGYEKSCLHLTWIEYLTRPMAITRFPWISKPTHNCGHRTMIAV